MANSDEPDTPEDIVPRKKGCGRVAQELVDFKNGLTMTGGDWGSLSQLFFDNLSTLLGALFALQGLKDFGVTTDTLNNVIFGRIVPGVGITLVVGNIYYSWQAVRLTNKWGRQYTAQPYGLNTPAAFAFVFNIIYAVFFANLGKMSPDEAFIEGYKVALGANFITGLISMFLGFFGRLILKIVPPAALLVPIAGIGIAFLGLEQLTSSIAAPIVGYSTIAWVYIGWYAGVKLGWGKYRIPEAVMVILVGVVLGWATGLNPPQATVEAAQLVKWWGPDWSAQELFADFNLVADYLGIIIPIGISAAATTLMCLVSAKEAGDPFPVRESMISDGIGTMIASFFGSPFGTVIYIGHPAHKRNGAKVGYSLVNGVIYLIFSWFGILALIQSIVNAATIGPIVFFVGLLINEEALNFMPSRHYSAYIIGLFPSIYDWCVNVCGRAPILDFVSGVHNGTYPTGSAGFIGVLAWKRGSLLVSMIWTAMVVMILDRKWITGAVWAFVGALFALFGIIHVPQAGFQNFASPTWEQCPSYDEATGLPNCWEFAEQWMFFVAYLMLAATFGLIEVARRYFDKSLEDVLDDPSAHAFDDWFADAAKPSDAESVMFGVNKHKKSHDEDDNSVEAVPEKKNAAGDGDSSEDDLAA